MQKVNSKEFEDRALEMVNGSPEPVTVDYVSKELKVSWDTGRALLLGLACRGRIVALKTMKSWVFLPCKETLESNSHE